MRSGYWFPTEQVFEWGRALDGLLSAFTDYSGFDILDIPVAERRDGW